MKITQEQLDKCAERAWRACVKAPLIIWDEVSDATKTSYRDIAKSALEAHFGEKIEVIEPEPEIPYGVIDAAASDMHRHLTPNELNHPCKCRVRVKAVLLAAYKAGWGGMRK